MRASRMYVLASVMYLLSVSAAHGAAFPKLAGIVTTDDCFSSFEGDGKKCDLGYCLSSVAGDSESSVADKYNLCSDSGRKIASQEATAADDTACSE